jgi:stage III sporulation protein AG
MQIPAKLREWIQAHRVQMIFALGLLGMVLILISGMMPKQGHDAPAAADQSAQSCFETELETRLTSLLSGMEGVGYVTVMVSVSGTAEQVYAEEVKETQSDRQRQRESAYVITKSGGQESALLSETRYPAVTGVAVLCSGGAHAAVRERVTEAVSTVLGLPASRIYVGSAANPKN